MKHRVKGLIVSAGICICAVLAAGCNSSEEPAGNLSCVVTRSCPAGYHCHAESGVCIEDTPCDLCDTQTEICYDNTCLQRCQSSSDCPAYYYCDPALHACRQVAVDGDGNGDGDVSDTPEEEEAEPEPCGGCAGNELCYNAPGAEEPSCLKRCDPYIPQCDNGNLCWLPFDSASLPLARRFVRSALGQRQSHG